MYLKSDYISRNSFFKDLKRSPKLELEAFYKTNFTLTISFQLVLLVF